MTRSHTDAEFIAFLEDQLCALPAVHTKAMFGGYGIYSDGVFFAIIHQGRVYFRVDDATRVEYEEAGMGPFKPSAKQTMRTYYEVPPDALDNPNRLIQLAESALAASCAAKK